MQVITAAQAALLTGPRLEVSAGLEVLNLDLIVTEDLSDDLAGGTIGRNMTDRIHGTCDLMLSTELPWGAELVRPYMLLSDGGVTARFNTGVYMLTTPEKPIGETPATFTVQGVDRLYLLDRQVAGDYTVTATTDYYTALVQVFTDAGLTGFVIDGSAADFTLPVDRTWALVGSSTNPDQTTTPVTWLRVVNDLLGAINFRGVWADENGIFRCQQYLEPAVRAPEFVFDADTPSINIIGENRTVIADQWKTPNHWVFRWTNRPGGMSATEGDGIYTVNNLNTGPTSQLARGIIWPAVIDYEAASQAVLTSLGDRRVASDLRVSEQIKATTGPFPCAGHADIFTYTDLAAGGSFKVQALDWQFDLLGGDVAWTFEVIS